MAHSAMGSSLDDAWVDFGLAEELEPDNQAVRREIMKLTAAYEREGVLPPGESGDEEC